MDSVLCEAENLGLDVLWAQNQSRTGSTEHNARVAGLHIHVYIPAVEGRLSGQRPSPQVEQTRCSCDPAVAAAAVDVVGCAVGLRTGCRSFAESRSLGIAATRTS